MSLHRVTGSPGPFRPALGLRQLYCFPLGNSYEAALRQFILWRRDFERESADETIVLGVFRRDGSGTVAVAFSAHPAPLMLHEHDEEVTALQEFLRRHAYTREAF